VVTAALLAPAAMVAMPAVAATPEPRATAVTGGQQRPMRQVAVSLP